MFTKSSFYTTVNLNENVVLLSCLLNDHFNIVKWMWIEWEPIYIHLISCI